MANSVQAEFDKIVDKSLINARDLYLREIEVGVSIAGFDPLEPVKLTVFDGKPVQLKSALGLPVLADANGVVQGTFKVPAGIPVGTKSVRIEGEGGSYCEANYTGSATIKLDVGFLYRGAFGNVGVGHQTVNYVI